MSNSNVTTTKNEAELTQTVEPLEAIAVAETVRELAAVELAYVGGGTAIVQWG